MFDIGVVDVTRARSAGGKDLPPGLVWVYFRTGAICYDIGKGEWYIDEDVERPEGAPIPPTPPAREGISYHMDAKTKEYVQEALRKIASGAYSAETCMILAKAALKRWEQEEGPK